MHPPRHFSYRRPWEPLCEEEWSVLAPFVTRDGPGRPVENPRQKLDAIFWLAAQHHRVRWRDLPEQFGKPDTVSRQFRRWAAQGLWHTLLKAMVGPKTPQREMLCCLASWLCRAYRRAWRLHGMLGVMLPQALGFLTALRGPPWLLPNPILSEGVVWPMACDLMARLSRGEPVDKGRLRAIKHLLLDVGGCRRIPRALVWP